jgi:cytochrome oxidase Cu insertion factor (SCO1/SenC/PrrC family)
MAEQKRQKRVSSKSGLRSSNTTAKSRWNVGMITGVATGVLAIAAYIIFFANNTPSPQALQVAGMSHPKAAEETTKPLPAEEMQFVVSSVSGAPKVGALAPNFNLVDITGKQISLSDYRGKPVVVSFFHTW